jgi:hypothetical protein
MARRRPSPTEPLRPSEAARPGGFPPTLSAGDGPGFSTKCNTLCSRCRATNDDPMIDTRLICSRAAPVASLAAAGVGLNEIARRVGVAPSTVRLTLKRLASAGFGWPLPAEMTDAALAALFSAVGNKQGHRRRAEPDWAEIHRELRRKHVTLAMLWDEYIERHPDGYRYSRFCELYRSWASRLSVTMRQAHVGGDKLFIDYAGDTVPVIVDRLTGQVRPAQIFVAVVGHARQAGGDSTLKLRRHGYGGLGAKSSAAGALQGSAIDGRADCAASGVPISSPAPPAHRCAAAGLDSDAPTERGASMPFDGAVDRLKWARPRMGSAGDRRGRPARPAPPSLQPACSGVAAATHRFASSRTAPISRTIAASLGKMPTTSARRLTLSRSSGLVLCNLLRCGSGKSR